MGNFNSGANKSSSLKVYRDEDLCRILGVSKRTLATYRKLGLINYSKPLGAIFYSETDLQEFLQSNRTESSHE